MGGSKAFPARLWVVVMREGVGEGPMGALVTGHWRPLRRLTVADKAVGMWAQEAQVCHRPACLDCVPNPSGAGWGVGGC